MSTPNKATWEWIFRIPRYILGQWGYISIYGFPSVALGAALAYGGILLVRPFGEVPFLILLGMSAWLPFLAYYSQPHVIVERKFKRWDRWANSGMITKTKCREMKQDLIEWYRMETHNSLPQSGRLPSLAVESPPQPEKATKSGKANRSSR